MPTPRKPTAVLEANGAFRHNPKRAQARANEPKPVRPIGSPPVHMTKAAKKVWKEIVKESVPGVLMSPDRAILEILSGLLAEYRADPAGFQSSRMILMTKLLSQCGFTPVDRARVQAVELPEEPANRFAEFGKPDSIARFTGR